MRVDIWSDVVCPWCYVGKARFEKALSTHPQRDEVAVVYHSFELDASYPADKRGETIHRVIHLRLANGVQRELLGAVNEAYFAQARQVFDATVITEIAAGAGLGPACPARSRSSCSREHSTRHWNARLSKHGA